MRHDRRQDHLVGRYPGAATIAASKNPHAEGSRIDHASGSSRQGLNARIADIGRRGRVLPWMALFEFQLPAVFISNREGFGLGISLQTADRQRRQHHHMT